MVEFAIVLVLKRKLEFKTNNNNEGGPREIEAVQRNNVNNVTFSNQPPPVEETTRSSDPYFEKNQSPTVAVKKNLISITDKIDTAAFILFLLSYSTFNFIYMVHYM